ncbi:polyadenylate-binding protein RBP47-like protein [Tanacetum coccineum]
MQVEFPIEAPMKDNGIKQNSYMENGKTDSQGVPEKIREENIKVIDDSTGVMAGELELKRPRATDNDGGEVQNVCNLENYSLNKSGSSSKHGSCNVPNGSNTTVNSEGTKVPPAAEKVFLTYTCISMPNTEQPFRLKCVTFSMGGEQSNNGSGISIFLGDLATDVINTLLHEPFANKYPSVKDVKLVIDSNIGCSKGYGFVRFSDDDKDCGYD